MPWVERLTVDLAGRRRFLARRVTQSYRWGSIGESPLRAAIIAERGEYSQ